jgi:hypothetical protein
LRIGATLAAAMRFGWRSGRSLAVLALAVVAPLVVGVELLIRVTGPVGVRAGIVIAVVSMSVLGEVFCAGLAEHMIRRGQLGLPEQSLRALAREVPFVRLAAASFAVSVVVLFGFVLLIVPGLVAFAFLVLTTPFVSLERTGVWQALRKSVALVRGNFWSVAALTTLTFVPAILGDWLSDEISIAHAPLWTELVVEIVTDALAVAVTAAIVVTMFDRLCKTAASPASEPPAGRP